MESKNTRPFVSGFFHIACFGDRFICVVAWSVFYIFVWPNRTSLVAHTTEWLHFASWPMISCCLARLCCVSHSVMSDSLQPHGLWPTRPLDPLNSPGKNIGVGCHSLLQGIFPTQGLNPGLLHHRQILYHVSHQRQFQYSVISSMVGWERVLEKVVYLSMGGHHQTKVEREGVGEKEKQSWVCYDEEEAGVSGKKTKLFHVSNFGL